MQSCVVGKYFFNKKYNDKALTDTSKFVFGQTNLLVSVSALSEFSPSVMPFKKYNYILILKTCKKVLRNQILCLFSDIDRNTDSWSD